MARPKEFDVDDALQSALEVFWQKGYEATSVQDLVETMGIQKASLYGTFGDKHSLYLAALRRYQDAALLAMRASLSAPGGPKASLRGLLQGVADQACRRGGQRGCFCVNTNVELAPHDREVADLMRAHSDRVVALLEDTLNAAKRSGELPRHADPQRLAASLFGVLVALNVFARQRAPRERVQALVDQAVESLGG